MNNESQISADLAHRLRVLDVLDKITQVSLANETMEEVMRGILDLVLNVFHADRAWFLYPCDPNALSWGVPMERSLPEWPGLFVMGGEIPMTSDMSSIYRELLEARVTIQYGPSTDHPIPPIVAEQFSVKSQLMIALRPKIGNAWVFGLHHCAAEVMHSEADIQLFTVIAQRISDSLNGLISIRQLRESEEQLRAFLENSAVIGWLQDEAGRYVFASNNFLKRFALAREAVIGKTESEIWPHTQLKEAPNPIQNGLEAHHHSAKSAEVVKAMTNPDDSISWWLCNEFMFNTSVGKRLFGSLGVDITARQQAEQQLHIAAAAFEAQEGILITDAHNVILRVNRSFTKITGYSAEEIIGKSPCIFKSDRHDADFFAAMWESILSTGSWDGEIWNRRKNGEICPERIIITAIKDQTGGIINYISTITDFTMSKEAADEIKSLAFYDPLTRLPNRRLFLDRLGQTLASSVHSGKPGALLLIDLDNFKTLNDTRGHDIGDLLLQQVAQRLVSCIDENGTVARLGGDEFVVVLEELSPQLIEAALETESIGNKILFALSQPYQLAQFEYHHTVSIGATLFDHNQQAIDELLKQADLALYQTKQAGRNTLTFFDPQMRTKITARALLESELRKALEQQQFQLHYQIQVDHSRRPVGAEALIRWVSPQHGLVSPAQFIALAEETGLILSIGQWVLETACAQIKAWQQQPHTRNLILAVNISAKQFHQMNFVSQVQTALQHHDINPAHLKLELTESVMLEKIEDTIATMNALKEIGIQLSLDDFGTGYSSLQYLKLLPLSQIKIDKSFIQDIDTNSSDKAIVRTIIAMAQSLNLTVMAEGVETEAQRQFLIDNGCDHYQGALFGSPAAIEEFEGGLLQQEARLN
jgi:diguanylate cyclase (GGDEF)-like protein/PAS domain S-box-containing protein